MPISYYSGKPGSGKSYLVVSRVIVPALKSGRTVVTNIPMTDDARALGDLVEFTRGDKSMIDIADMLLHDKSAETGEYEANTEYAGSIFVLDEFSFLLPAGIKTASINDKIKAFFSMHRHITGKGFSTEIVIISQSSSQIAVYVKDMIDQSYRIEKTMLGKLPIVNLTIFSGCVGYRGGAFKAQELKKETIKYDKNNFKYYKSQTLGDSQSAEVRTDDATNVLKSPAFKMFVASLFLFPVLVFFGYRAFMGLFQVEEPEPEVKNAPVASAPPVLSPAIEFTPYDPLAKAKAAEPEPEPEPEPEKIIVPRGKQGAFRGAQFWVLGSEERNGVIDYWIGFETNRGLLSMVYSSDLKNLFGYEIEETKSGLLVMTIDGEPYVLPKYEAPPKEKAFFSTPAVN